MEELSKIQESSLKTEIIGAYIDFDKFDPEIAENRLFEISSSGDSVERYTITRRLWFTNLVNQDREIEILRECAKDKNPQVQANLFQVFGQKGKLFLDESLEIIKSMLKSDGYHSNSMSDFYFQELCKEKNQHCVETLEKWLGDEKADTMFCFYVSQLLVLIRN